MAWQPDQDPLPGPAWEHPEIFEQLCLRAACWGLSPTPFGDPDEEIAQIRSLWLAGRHPETRVVAALTGRGRPPATVAAQLWDRWARREASDSYSVGIELRRLAAAHFGFAEPTDPLAAGVTGRVGDLRPIPDPPSSHPKLYEQWCVRKTLHSLSCDEVGDARDGHHAIHGVVVAGEHPQTRIVVVVSLGNGPRGDMHFPVWRDDFGRVLPPPFLSSPAMFSDEVRIMLMEYQP